MRLTDTYPRQVKEARSPQILSGMIATLVQVCLPND